MANISSAGRDCEKNSTSSGQKSAANAMNSKTSVAMQNSAEAAHALDALVRGLIDYAGLFPPASLPMAAAVANYANYSRSEYSWILGRFILPVARLGEFEQALGNSFAETSGDESVGRKPWALSALPGADVAADLVRIREFANQSAHSAVKIETQSLEIKVTSPQEIERLSAIIPRELEAYFEVPLSPNPRHCISAIANAGRRAKIRTGGETADKFPSPESVIDFIRQCAAANVAFKATAGLHHPLRSQHRFTYQPESPSGVMHGFLNVFLAAAFLRAGMDVALALELLKEQSAQTLHFDSDGVVWREHRLTLRDIQVARNNFSISFGSCSFTEPVEDLRALHLL
jgi:hypothetical protein